MHITYQKNACTCLESKGVQISGSPNLTQVANFCSHFNIACSCVSFTQSHGNGCTTRYTYTLRRHPEVEQKIRFDF